MLLTLPHISFLIVRYFWYLVSGPLRARTCHWHQQVKLPASKKHQSCFEFTATHTLIFKNNWQSSSSPPQSYLQIKYGAWMPSQCLHGGHLLRFSKHKKRSNKNVILKYSRRLALKLRWGMANNQKTLPALVTTCQTFREAVTSWAPGLRCWQLLWKLTTVSPIFDYVFLIVIFAENDVY